MTIISSLALFAGLVIFLDLLAVRYVPEDKISKTVDKVMRDIFLLSLIVLLACGSYSAWTV